jgi:flagellin-like protein
MQLKKWNFYKDDGGISPIVGVVLMVAITVMMAAIVSTWSSDVKAPATPTTIGLDIIRDANNVSIVITSIDPISAAPLPFLNATYQYWDEQASVFRTKTISVANVNVGEPIDFDTNSAEPKRLIILAIYKDDSKKVLYSQDV